ncbi:hypothetical protein FTX61_10050 [Nitriliruptoraceae bacterium ZYF776]|nr:hypothetical protein [Profundirhabdus halotolerans]
MTDRPPLDPVPEDEDRVLALQELLDATELWGEPRRDGPDRGARCDGCAHYLNPPLPLAYCWHPEVRLLVGASWSCRHHTPDPAG